MWSLSTIIGMWKETKVKWNRLNVVTFVVSAVLMITSSGVLAQVDPSCVEGKCHADMGTKSFVHGPVGAGACVICHNQVPNKKHEFNLAAKGEELCLGCHEQKREWMLQENVHSPLIKGNCTGCHDPHQSDFRFTLKEEGSKLCYNCHEQEMFTKKHVHGPVAVGDCNVCHSPHASENEFQLLVSKDKLCIGCHKEKVDDLSMRHVHPPVSESCTNCHSPHSDDAKYLLPVAPPQLCFDCHSELSDVATREYPHQPAASGNCKACHNSHASDNPNMFRLPQEELCFSCHDEMAEYVTGSNFKHGPVKEGDCVACHNPHGSGNYRILKKYFPKEFYIGFKQENYAACFECHNSSIALDPKTKTLTGFRDGERNLHYVHVNKEVKGRSCKACHQPHATDQAKHIRKSVPYGSMNWDLPVNFTITENGGSCVVGCHAPKEYRRK